MDNVITIISIIVTATSIFIAIREKAKSKKAQVLIDKLNTVNERLLSQNSTLLEQNAKIIQQNNKRNDDSSSTNEILIPNNTKILAEQLAALIRSYEDQAASQKLLHDKVDDKITAKIAELRAKLKMLD